MGTESEWCGTRVENWLRKHYEDVQRDRNHFPDFRVGKDLAVEVTALKTLGRRIPRASKLLICGLFQEGRVLAQDGHGEYLQKIYPKASSE